jgi:acetyl esterase/lipase
MRSTTLLNYVFVALLLSSLTGCAFKSISRHKNITYQPADRATGSPEEKLNIFSPRKNKELKNVLVFIHGGGWTSGKKSLYNFFGSRMARKDVVMVIIDYPLAPEANYTDMARSSARAAYWVKQNIDKYGGDPDKIFISGHSAGGHLAALIAIKEAYFDSLKIVSPIKGAVLIDAGGLDMYGYLSEEKFKPDHSYYKAFTNNPIYWKDASPLYHLHKDMPPLLIYRGENTYPSIIKSTTKFVAALKEYIPEPDYHVLKHKKHVAMITQFFNPWNPRYDEIINFMHKVDNRSDKKRLQTSTESND